MLSSIGISMHVAIQQVDTSLRAMAECTRIKEGANFNNNATLSMLLGLKHRTTAGGERAQHMRQKEIAVARVATSQSRAPNAAHATRHACLATRHNVWYGNNRRTQRGGKCPRHIQTHYCLVDHVRSLAPVSPNIRDSFGNTRRMLSSLQKQITRQRMHSRYTI